MSTHQGRCSAKQSNDRWCEARMTVRKQEWQFAKQEWQFTRRVEAAKSSNSGKYTWSGKEGMGRPYIKCVFQLDPWGEEQWGIDDIYWLDLLDLERLQCPSRYNLSPNLPIQNELVYLLAVVKPHVPPQDVYIGEVWASPTEMPVRGSERRSWWVRSSSCLMRWSASLILHSAILSDALMRCPYT